MHRNNGRQVRVLLTLSSVVLIGSCSPEGVGPTGPGASRPPSQPQSSIEDCTLGFFRCRDIQSAITDLKQSTISGCRANGNLAQMRFDAEGYGYHAGDMAFPTQVTYVFMDPNPSFASGWMSSDANVYVNESFWDQDYTDRQMAGIIAHEEYHQRGEDGPNHNTGLAEGAESTCGT